MKRTIYGTAFSIGIFLMLAALGRCSRDVPLAGPSDGGEPDMGAAERCVASGGVVRGDYACCNGTPDFPNLCQAGFCSCAGENSRATKICACDEREGKCWDGNTCVNFMH